MWTALLLVLAGGIGQDPAPSDEVERLYRAATTGRSVVRPQAARRLVELGGPGEARLEEAVVEVGLAQLGPPIIEALGGATSSVLREALWTAVREPRFPWTPSAARALAESPSATELEGFLALRTSPLGEVRTAVVVALTGLDHPSKELDRFLLDVDERVRSAAAEALAARGEGAGFWYLVRELQRTDHFFERPTGQAARGRAARALVRLGMDLHGLAAIAEPGTEGAVRARKLIEEELVARFGSCPEWPLWVQPGQATPDVVLGLELRSCTEGEMWLRWTAADQLLVGLGRPAILQLSAGTTDALLKALGEGLDQVGDKRLFGVPGCDMEQLLVRRGSQARTENLLLVKGPDPVPGLRPEPLQSAWAAMVRSLPEATEADPRLAELPQRVARILAALGGPVGPR